MLTDLRQGRDVAFPPVAVDQERADSRRPRSLDVLLRRVAHVDGLVCGATGELQGRPEDRGVGLAGARHRRADGAVEKLAEAAALENARKGAVPVRDGDQAQATVPQ